MTKKLTTGSPLRQRMIEDMVARNLVPDTQRGHIFACKQFAAFLGRSPETATVDDLRSFQLHLIDSGRTIFNRNRIMNGVKFLLRVTMRRHDLAAEVYHLREPETVAVVMAPEEVARVLAHGPGLKARVMLTIAYSCGLRGGEVGRLKVGDIDTAHAQRLESLCRTLQFRIEATNAKADQRRLHSVDEAALLADQAFPLPVRPLGILSSSSVGMATVLQ